MFSALYLLQRLKHRFPARQGSSGHRLFIIAFMIAAKGTCDATYSNLSWSKIAQKMFTLREINQMEREMCSYLGWQLNIEPNMLKEFEVKVCSDFKGLGQYPTYVLPSPAPSPMPSTPLYTVQTGTAAPIPSFIVRSQQPPSTSSPKPIPPQAPVPVHTGAPPYSTTSSPHTPGTPDNPESSMSTSTSPTSSVRYEDRSTQVMSSRMIGAQTTASHIPCTSLSSATFAHRAERNVHMVLKKEQYANIFARASPCLW